MFKFEHIKGIKPDIRVGELKEILKHYGDHLRIGQICSHKDTETGKVIFGVRDFTAIGIGYAKKESCDGETYPITDCLGFGFYDDLEEEYLSQFPSLTPKDNNNTKTDNK